MIGGAVDWVMDRSVVPGYSSIGFRVRGLGGSSPDPEGRLRGADVVVTGAGSGIGAAAAETMASLGARVQMVVRDVEKGEDARARISERTGNDELRVRRCDVSVLDSVRELAAELATELDGIDALVHNAGVMCKERERSPDGIELTLATHVVGPLLLTDSLTPLLAARPASKVLFVSSGGMYTERLDVEDLELDRREFDGASFYAHAKRIQVILAQQLDARLEAHGSSAHAMHPGWVDTPGVADALATFHRVTRPVLRTPEQGADTIVWLAASREAARHGGGLWMDRRMRPLHRVPWTNETEAERDRLWARLTVMAELADAEVSIATR